MHTVVILVVTSVLNGSVAFWYMLKQTKQQQLILPQSADLRSHGDRSCQATLKKRIRKEMSTQNASLWEMRCSVILFINCPRWLLTVWFTVKEMCPYASWNFFIYFFQFRIDEEMYGKPKFPLLHCCWQQYHNFEHDFCSLIQAYLLCCCW